VPRIFITGSTDGLGRGAAGVLIGDGHDVVLHARSDTAATVSGGYWHHRRQEPASQARDPTFQDQLMDRLAALTGVTLL
jgi:NAD(P)-dependent dehydrogenase (short-subunit alcohol dehydrogenase family)